MHMYMHVHLTILSGMDISYQHYEMQHDLQQNAHPENSDHTHVICVTNKHLLIHEI